MKLETYLETYPQARLRSNKDSAMVNLLMKKYPVLTTIEKKTLVEMVKDYNSMDRQWRKILEDRPELRGSDYDDKERLEQKKQVELGYEVGFTRDKKTLF